MSLERLVAEIKARGEGQLFVLTQEHAAEKERLLAERSTRITTLQSEFHGRAVAEAARERNQRVAGARMQARKVQYEAEEQAMRDSLESVRDLLRQFTSGDEYPDVLRRMYAVASSELGKDLRISGRAEDAPLLRSLAGRGFDPTPAPILGGLIAESAGGERRLVLSLDELLRLREDRVRALLA